MTEYRGGKKWVCEYCTYENWPAAKKCILCRAPKPLQFITQETSPREQDIYKVASLACQESLTETAPPGKPLDHGHGNKWACQMCTYLNWPKAVKCTQCLTRRPKAVQIVTPTVTQPLSINVSISESCVASNASYKKSPRTSPNSPEAAKAINNDKNRVVASVSKGTKWTCKACTYENWPKAMKCTLCNVSRGKAYTDATPKILDNVIIGQSLSSSNQKNPKNQKSPPLCIQALDSPESQQLGGAAAAPTACQEKYSQDRNRTEEKKVRHVRKCLRDSDWLWIHACRGVVEGDSHALEAFLAAGGDSARQLSADECAVLNRPSAFQLGYTLVHLAIRFQREDMLAALLTATDVVTKAKKRVPSYIAPDIASDILREISSCLRLRKGDFPCYFLTDIATFILPADIEDLPNAVKKQLFDELLDQGVQKELEDEEPIVNWSLEVTERLGSRLYALWNRTAGDCLLDSVLQASWGIMDKDNTLRRALADSLSEGATCFYPRWKEAETMQAQSLHFSLDENQWQQDWAILLSLASQPGSSLEQIHIFALAHILRRPIIVYGIKFVKSFRGENIGLARFQGVYLPLLWEPSFCWRTPISLGYTRGHFTALVPMEIDVDGHVAAGAHIDNHDEGPVSYLPLMDSQGKILPVHFLQASQLGRDESVLREWLDCCVTDGGLLVARQKVTKRPMLVRQMVEEWLTRYRRLAHVVQSAPCPATTSTQPLSSDDETDDE